MKNKDNPNMGEGIEVIKRCSVSGHRVKLQDPSCFGHHQWLTGNAEFFPEVGSQDANRFKGLEHAWFDSRIFDRRLLGLAQLVA